MVKKNLVLFGANSEFAKAFSNLAKEQGHSIFGISRSYIDNLDINNQLKIDQNYENLNEIEKFISNIDDPYIIFFNGFLAENRDIYFPTNKEMAEPDIILKANEILGEMGVIDTAPRMATAKALTDCIVIFVSQKEFEKKLDEGDMIVRGVMAILSSRLRELQKRR